MFPDVPNLLLTTLVIALSPLVARAQTPDPQPPGPAPLAQVNHDKTATSTVMLTARLIQVLPEINQLNELIRFSRLRYKWTLPSRKSTTRSPNPMKSAAIFLINGTGLSTVPIY